MDMQALLLVGRQVLRRIGVMVMADMPLMDRDMTQLLGPRIHCIRRHDGHGLPEHDQDQDERSNAVSHGGRV